MLVVSQSPPAKESNVPEPIVTSNGVHYKAERGAPGYGFAVLAYRPLPASYCTVVAGPFTNEPDAWARAAELAARHELELNPSSRVARGLDELAARRVASALGVELGPLTEAEVAATAELERAAAELGLEVPA
jgi:FAD/FMN-containing dehydrogenase